MHERPGVADLQQRHPALDPTTGRAVAMTPRKSKRAYNAAESEEPAVELLTDDEELALVLLNGAIGPDEHGLLTKKYLVDEREAREAIARLLHSEAPLHPILRFWLAILFGPDGDGSWPGERQLVFRFRKQGRRKDFLREAGIVRSVLLETDRGLTVEKAIAVTAKRYRLSEEAIRHVWKQYPPRLRPGRPLAPPGAPEGNLIHI
jgi:hypothetical protein